MSASQKGAKGDTLACEGFDEDLNWIADEFAGVVFAIG
jgi:hypothetical protein